MLTMELAASSQLHDIEVRILRVDRAANFKIENAWEWYAEQKRELKQICMEVAWKSTYQNWGGGL